LSVPGKEEVKRSILCFRGRGKGKGAHSLDCLASSGIGTGWPTACSQRWPHQFERASNKELQCLSKCMRACKVASYCILFLLSQTTHVIAAILGTGNMRGTDENSGSSNSFFFQTKTKPTLCSNFWLTSQTGTSSSFKFFQPIPTSCNCFHLLTIRFTCLLLNYALVLTSSNWSQLFPPSFNCFHPLAVKKHTGFNWLRLLLACFSYL